MKAVLGLVFILVGVTTGWLVLSGKLPNPNALPPQVSASASPAAPTQTGTIASMPYQPPTSGHPVRGPF